jgi:ribosomal protein S18 acetylase RimI-like enzyme
MIRLGTQDDLQQIDIFDEFGGDRIQEIKENRLTVYLIADQVIGYITTIDRSCLCGHPLISFLCVHPEYRRRGIASKLLTEVESKYSDRKLFISTESNNPIMLSLIKQRDYIMAGSLAKINDDGSDEVYFYQGAAK